jgi:hypothetical protein
MFSSRARRSIGSEEGIALMEVVVSAAVLILVVLGVMAALDAVAGTAGANKARTVAATLAEKDQEELRSLKTADLNRLETLIPAPRTVEVDGVPYTITSEARIVTDATGEDISCALDTGKGTFVRITSTVTSPMTGAKVKPVTMSSIVAPEPGSGTLVAMVRNAKDNPVVNMPVTADNGIDVKTVRTNDAGCAVFGAMESGSYELEVDQMDWVDPDGNQEVIKSATVAAGTLSTVEFLYDIGATVRVQVATTPVTGTAQWDDSYGIVAGHNGISTNFRTFPDDPPLASPAQNHTLRGLFPFHEDAYKIYSGTCTLADPVPFQENYFDLLDDPEESLVDATPELTPGEERTITLFEQAININATWSTSTAPGSAITHSGTNPSAAYAYPRTAGTCSAPPRIPLGNVVGGRASRPGVPFGTYDVCVHRLRSGSTSSNNVYYRRTITGVQVDRSPGTPVQNIALNTSAPTVKNEQCPPS